MEMEMEMDATSSEFRDWADGMPLDLLYRVRDLLGFPDLVRFRAVCRPWRERIPSMSMPSPWVVIPGGTSVVNDWEEFKFVSLPNNVNLTRTFPGARCVGSIEGWLALVDTNLCITLVNALASAADVQARAVKLPPLLTLPGNISSSTACIRILQRCYIERMAFSLDPSSGDYAAAVLCRYGNGVAFTNSGRAGWQRLHWPLVRGEPEPPDPSPEDELDDRHISRNTGLDVVYHGGRFYYMTACGRIWALDATAPPDTRVTPVLFATSQVPRAQLLRYGKHMVFSEDGALHVVWSDLDGMPRTGGINNGSLVRRWKPMRIQRYEPGSPWGWREVHHLGGRAFLIGSCSQSVCLEEPARKKTWLSPNCVYFTNIMPGYNLELRPNTHPYIMEFNVVNAVFSTRNHFDLTEEDDQPVDVDYPWLYPGNLPAGHQCLAWWSKGIWFTP